MKSDERDPFDRVMDEAGALHDVAIEELPSDLGAVLRSVVRGTKARPFTALVAAALVGFVVALVTTK